MSEPGRALGHVFISCAREDADDADRLQHALEQTGIRVWRDVAEIAPGQDWRAEIRRAITEKALVFLALFSRTGQELRQSRHHEELLWGVGELRRRRPLVPWLIPVRLDDCEIPDLEIGGGRTLRSIQPTDLFGDGAGSAIERLVAAIRQILSADRTDSVSRDAPLVRTGTGDCPAVEPGAAWPQGYAASRQVRAVGGGLAGSGQSGRERGAGRRQIVVGDVPHEPPGYQPRTELLAVVDAPEQDGRYMIVRALTGMRGVGKTQVAAAYARQRIADGWWLVAWIHAKDVNAIVAGMEAVAAALGAENAGADSADLVRHWLEIDGDQCLLVFDNATDPDVLRPFLPAAGRSRILVTSNRQSVGLLGSRVLVSEFTPDQAHAYLHARTGLTDADGAQALAADLGWLPLALAQAAAVIAEQKLDYETYRGRLREMPVEQLLGRVEADQYPSGLAAAVLVSLDGVRAEDDSGICGSIMELMAVLTSGAVPREMMHAAGADAVLGAPARLVQAAQVDEALGRLARTSMLTFSVDGSSITAHRLVRRVIRDQLAREGQLTRVCHAAVTVLERLCEPAFQDRRNRGAVNELIQQITALYEHSAPVLGQDESLARRLLDLRMWALTLMNILRDTAHQAVLLGESVLAQAQEILGDGHINTLNTGNDLATAYRAAGQADMAIRVHEQVVEACARTLGHDHPQTLGYLSNLANAYQDAGRTDSAIEVHERVLAAREQILGPDHPDTLTSRCNRAVSYQIKGRTSEAVAIQEQVLADRLRVLGADHPDTLSSRSNLANAYQQAGRIHEVLALLEQALADHEQFLGATHPDTIAVRVNLANALLDAGRPGEAVDLHRASAADAQSALGREHPATLVAQSSLATACKDTGLLSEAIPLYELALAGQEKTLGPLHPQTMNTRGNLAVAYGMTGRQEQAIQMLERTRADQERTLGARHPDTLNTKGNLANSYQAAGKAQQAMHLYEQVLTERERALPPRHPNVLISRGNLAASYALAGRLREAAELFKSTLDDCEQTLGTQHPITQATRHNQSHTIADELESG